MELLNIGFLNVFATAVVACLLLTAFTCLGLAFGFRRRFGGYLFIAVFAFSMLGFVSGDIMSNSREPSVSAVLPAVLTLMGGVAAFQIGSKGVENQVAVCTLIFVFSLALYTGSFYGAQVRGENAASVSGDIELEKNRLVIDLQRLEDYVELQKLKHGYESEEQVDLSRFESHLERSDRSTDVDRRKPPEK
jgi:hypothetical protein